MSCEFIIGLLSLCLSVYCLFCHRVCTTSNFVTKNVLRSDFLTIKNSTHSTLNYKKKNIKKKVYYKNFISWKFVQF